MISEFQKFYSQSHSVLQTYNAGACNGLDIRADHHMQDLNDLKIKIEQMNTL
jgi:hypothetical protein